MCYNDCIIRRRSFMSISERIKSIANSDENSIAITVGNEDENFLAKVGKGLKQNKIFGKTSAAILTVALSLGAMSNTAQADVGFNEDISKLAYHLESEGKTNIEIENNGDAFIAVSNLKDKMESARGLDIDEFAHALVNQIEKNEGEIIVPAGHALYSKTNDNKFDAFENFNSSPHGHVSENVRKLAFNLEQRNKTTMELNNVDDAYDIVQDFKSKMSKASHLSAEALADILIPKWEKENGEIELPNYLTYSQQSPQFDHQTNTEFNDRMNDSFENLREGVDKIRKACDGKPGKMTSTTENGVKRSTISCRNS